MLFKENAHNKAHNSVYMYSNVGDFRRELPKILSEKLILDDLRGIFLEILWWHFFATTFLMQWQYHLIQWHLPPMPLVNSQPV